MMQRRCAVAASRKSGGVERKGRLASVFRAAFQKTQAENYTISAGLWQIENKWKKVDQMGWGALKMGPSVV